MNIAGWLQQAGRDSRDAPALRLGDQVVASYEQFAGQAAGMASALQDDLGARPGDRVAIVAGNRPEYLVTMFAAWWAGLVVVPVNAKLHPAEAEWVIDHSGARVVFTDEKTDTGLAGRSLPGVDALVQLGDDRYSSMVRASPAALTGRKADDLAWLFYTSGTTGRPKGAALSHANLVAMSFSYLTDVDPTQRGDSIVHAAPMSHGSGLYSMAHVCRRATNVYPESGGFDESELLGLASSLGRVSMFAAPTMVQRLSSAASEDQGGFRTIVWGGAPMHPSETVRALDRFGPCLAQIYGQGETPMTISYLPKHVVADRDDPDWSRRLASAGVPHSAVEVRVAGAHGGAAAVDEAGEVQVRGATVMVATGQIPKPPRPPSTTAGSAPETSAPSTPTASCSSATAFATSSSPEAPTSTRARSRTSCSRIPACARRRSSAAPTTIGGRSWWRSSPETWRPRTSTRSA